MKILCFITLFLAIIYFLGSKSLAQKDKLPYVVTPLIGDTLTLEERDYYMLFPQIEEFQFAVFYLNPDSSLNAVVKYYDDGILKDTLIENYKSIKSLNYHIYARNALENGSLDTFHPVYESPEYKEGSEVCAYMNDGRETSGELLSVRKSSLLILKPDCDDDLKNPDCISKINTSEIDKLVVKGSSNVAGGIVLGIVAAIAVGAIIYQSNYENSSSWLRGLAAYEKSKLPIILSSIGCITLGVTIGIATSTPDEEIKTFSKYEISGLSTHSRYQSNEPNELKKTK